MTIVDRIRVLANMEDMSIPDVETKLGFGSGTISRWKKSSPSVDKIEKIADLFHVSVDYLLERDDNKCDKYDVSKDLQSILSKLKDGEGIASFDGVSIPEDDLELFAGQLELMLNKLKAINKEKYSPK